MSRRWTRWAVAGTGAVTVLAVAAPGAQAEITGLPSWEVVAKPAVGEFTNTLAGVHAVSPAEAWAVGSALGRGERGQVRRTLLQRWDGQAWRQVPPPALPDGRVAQLGAVAGTGPDDVWAVGTATAPDANVVTGHRTVTLHWDGRVWTAVPSPNLGFLGDNNRLLGVAAIAPNDVWAVGEFADGTFGTTRASILLHWDGASWRSVNHPCGAGLRAVSASSASDVWAVGGNVACHFDGSSWTAAAPAPPPVANRRVDLDDVTVLGPTEAWAVGRVVFGCGENICSHGEIQRWNGAAWTRFATPPGTLRGVHAVAANDVWAVSWHDAMQHFDGTEWSRVPAPSGALEDVAASGPADLWAVGATNGGSPSVAQIQHAAAPSTGTIVGGVNHAGAVISWSGTASGSVAVRNGFGEYEIVSLPAGDYDLIVTASGCAPQVRPVSVTAGRIDRQDFTLSC